MTTSKPDAEPTPAEREAIARALAAEAEAKKAQIEATAAEANAAAATAASAETLRGTRLDNDAKARTAILDAVPALDKVAASKLDVAEGSVMFAELVVARALTAAAHEVTGVVSPALTSDSLVLITSDGTLVDRLGIHRDLTHHLTQLAAVVRSTVEQSEGLDDDRHGGPHKGTRPVTGFLPIDTAIGVVGRLLPGVLSLFAAQRSITTKTATIDEQTAVMAVAGSVVQSNPGTQVLLDQTRLLTEETAIEQAFSGLGLAIDQLRVRIAECASLTNDAAVAWTTTAKALLDVAATAQQKVVTIPEGELLSPLSSAAANEILTESALTHVFVVKPTGASTAQLTSDRPLAMKDPVHIAATVSLSYVLIERSTSRVLHAGICSGESSLFGKIGSRLEVSGS